MRSTNNLFVAAALAGLAAASPAPQQLDFGQISAAPTVANGPSNNGAVVQTASIPTSVTISTTAIASITGVSTTAAASATSAAQKRALQERDLWNTNWWCTWFNWGCPSSSSSTTSTTAKSTSSTSVTPSSASTTGYTPYYPALASVTQYTTGTTTISSTSSCPTTPEQGTYCGFINPEDPCAPQPDGYGPVPTPDTVSAFYAYAPFHSMASAAPSTIVASAVASVSGVPAASGVTAVYQQTFKDLNASAYTQSYLGLYTLQTYNAAQCASYCDNTALCTSFNLFVERDPSVAPCNNDSTAPTVWGYNCPNPASMTSYKCLLFGSNLDASLATQTGQWREQFQIVVTASNGWDKTNLTAPAAPSGTSCNGAGWNKGINLGGKAINAASFWMGSKFFPGPYNPQICSNYAVSQNTLNKAQAVSKGLRYYTPCNMVNAYYLNKNNQPLGTYCTLYDTDVSSYYASYSGGFSGSDIFSCKQSYKFTLQTVDTGKC